MPPAERRHQQQNQAVAQEDPKEAAPEATKCVNHPDREAVFTTPEDAGFAKTSFCKECAESLPPGPLRTAFQKQQTEAEES